MYNLTDLSQLKMILKKHGFEFNKSFGQNFLINEEIPYNIVKSSGINEKSGVIEIGPGMGTLTYELCRAAKKVVAVEIDKKLIPVLDDTLSFFDNVKVINADVLKTDLKKLIDEEFAGMDVFICANLPYYITSPIIMKLLEEELPVKSITVMVQKEVALRLCATEKDKDYGAISLAVRFYSNPRFLFDVSSDNFIPAPKVVSSVITLSPKKERVKCLDYALMFRIIKAAFSQRRKTLLNALSNSGILAFEKEEIRRALSCCGFNEAIRGEKLSIEDFASLTDALLSGADK